MAGVQAKIFKELSAPDKQEQLKKLARMAQEQNVTLIYSARDSEHNNARVLEELISDLMKDQR